MAPSPDENVVVALQHDQKSSKGEPPMFIPQTSKELDMFSKGSHQESTPPVKESWRGPEEIGFNHVNHVLESMNDYFARTQSLKIHQYQQSLASGGD